MKPVLVFWTTVLSALAVSTGSLFALAVTCSESPPDTYDVILFFDDEIDWGSHPWEHGAAKAIDVGQTFRLPVQIELRSITVKVRPVTEIGGELITLLIGPYSGIDDPSMNDVLHFEVGGLPSSLAVDQVCYLTLKLQSPLTLNGEQQYGFVLGFTGGGNVNNARAEMLHLGGDSYPEGQAVTHFGGFMEALEEDLVFFLRVESLFSDDFESGDLGRWSSVVQ